MDGFHFGRVLDWLDAAHAALNPTDDAEQPCASLVLLKRMVPPNAHKNTRAHTHNAVSACTHVLAGLANSLAPCDG